MRKATQVLWLAFMVMVSACANAASPYPTDSPALADPRSGATGAAASATPPAQATQAASPTPSVESTATHALRTDFVATDPTTVKLAAGKPQLIEFFAYD
jgi:hypothetical protein